MELFFGVRLAELEEETLSIPCEAEEKVCVPLEQKEECDDVSQAGDDQASEVSEEESISEEESEEDSPRVAGIDDAAMG